jgi:uncharacterized membrane protein
MNIYWMIGIILISVLIVGYYIIIAGNRNNKPQDAQDSWKLLFIYYNPDDPRIFVPKRVGIGFTFNFARPFPKLLILGLVIFLILHGFSLL